jgi:hypothetical protein
MAAAQVDPGDARQELCSANRDIDAFTCCCADHGPAALIHWATGQPHAVITHYAPTLSLEKNHAWHENVLCIASVRQRA